MPNFKFETWQVDGKWRLRSSYCEWVYRVYRVNISRRQYWVNVGVKVGIVRNKFQITNHMANCYFQNYISRISWSLSSTQRTPTARLDSLIEHSTHIVLDMWQASFCSEQVIQPIRLSKFRSVLNVIEEMTGRNRGITLMCEGEDGEIPKQCHCPAF